jgi:hypothetical protein
VREERQPTDRPPVIAIYQQLISNKSTHASSTQAAIRLAVNGFFAHATSLLRAAGRTRIVDEVEGSTSCALVCSISVNKLNIMLRIRYKTFLNDRDHHFGFL